MKKLLIALMVLGGVNLMAEDEDLKRCKSLRDYAYKVYGEMMIRCTRYYYEQGYDATLDADRKEVVDKCNRTIKTSVNSYYRAKRAADECEVEYFGKGY